MVNTGFIYKLVCSDVSVTEKYVGSTKNWRVRKANHKSVCGNENGERYNCPVYVFIRANGGWINWNMVEVEKYECDTKRELEARERYWIETLNAELNKRIPARTRREYYDDNVESIAIKGKQYRQENKEACVERCKQYQKNNVEAIAEQRKQHYQENRGRILEEKKRHGRDNAEKISTRKRLYYQQNKERILAREKQRQHVRGNIKYDCCCEGKYTDASKLTHLKSKRHQEYENFMSLTEEQVRAMI